MHCVRQHFEAQRATPTGHGNANILPHRSRPLIHLISVVLLLALAAPAADGDTDLNRPFLDPDFASWVKRFESPGREVYDRRAAIEAATGLKPGMHVADVGAGTGLFTLAFARAVGPQGRVHAVDVSRPFAENILRRARAQGLANVDIVVNTQSDSGLPTDSIDLAFVCDTYHHFERPRAMLDSIRRALRAGGVLVVVDYERIEGRSSRWVLQHVRDGKDEVRREIEAAGFRLVTDEPVLEQNFFLRFVKPAPEVH
jgi:predicted methyltransferase